MGCSPPETQSMDDPQPPSPPGCQFLNELRMQPFLSVFVTSQRNYTTAQESASIADHSSINQLLNLIFIFSYLVEDYWLTIWICHTEKGKTRVKAYNLSLSYCKAASLATILNLGQNRVQLPNTNYANQMEYRTLKK